MVPVTLVVKTCDEPSAKVTVMVTVAVLPSAGAQPTVSVLVAESVCPGCRPPVHAKLALGKVQPAGRPEMAIVGFVVEIGTSPVFFSTTVNVPAPAGDTTSFTWSIIAVGLLPAMPARLKNTPETTTAAATVIATSRITATNGLKPSDLFLLFMP